MNIQNKRVFLLGGTVLGILVIVGVLFAVWMNRAPTPSIESEPPSGQTAAGANDKSEVRYRQTGTQTLALDLSGLFDSYFIKYEGEPAHYQDGKAVSLATGEAVWKFPEGFSYDGFASFCFDSASNLWVARYSEEQNAITAASYGGQGNALSDEVVLKDCKLAPDYPVASVTKMRVDSERIYIYYTGQQAEDWLQIFDHAGNLLNITEGVYDFDVDGEGNVYLCRVNSLEKRSGPELAAVWAQKLEKGRLHQKHVWYEPQSNTVLLQGDAVEWYDAETGNCTKTNLKIGVDTAFSPEEIGSAGEWRLADFACDKAGNVYFFLTSFASDPQESEKMVFQGTIYTYSETDAGTQAKTNLVVTMPYRQEYVLDAARKYESGHSDILIVFDTAYATRDEFIQHNEAYSEQLTLRILSNDVGDIVMTAGAGLAFDQLFRSDAFIELDDYVKSTPNAADWNMAVLDASRVGGKLCGLPASASHSLYLYNETMARRMGLDMDPVSIKWGDLLALAEQWDASGTDACVLAGGVSQDAEGLYSPYLYSFVFANIWDLVDFDAKTVDLNQEWFREALQKWKKLKDSPCLIREYPAGYSSASPLMENSLLCIRDSSLQRLDYGEESSWRKFCSGSSGIEFAYMPAPRGEQSANRIAYTINMYSISGASQKPDLAWDFLASLLSEELQKMPSLNGVAVNWKAEEALMQEALNRKNGTDPNMLKLFRPIYENVDHLYEPSYFGQDIMPSIEAYMKGEMTLEDALRQAEQNLFLRLNE